ncbi:MAG: heme ABC transporter permease [Sphaerospermopsis sp. SIO1G2]|nr:heme ABC transporter permease [Sphaerospermopsis sp. SIO1G2]
MFTQFANPTRFATLCKRATPWLSLCATALLAIGTYYALIASPADYQQGESVRIMYIHVPAAWSSLGIYLGMALASAIFLIWKHPVADMVARHSAIVAMVMAAVTLVTGALWGKPTWGAYWVWDARLTSMLILLLMVTGYHMLACQSDAQEARQKACAYLCLFGAINLPIIKFSVEWWNTLHQPASVFREGGNAIDPSMQVPLFLMAAGFFMLYLLILSLRMQTALLKAKNARLQHKLINQQHQRG